MGLGTPVMAFGDGTAYIAEPGELIAEGVTVKTLVGFQHGVLGRSYFLNHGQDLRLLRDLSPGDPDGEWDTPAVSEGMNGVALALVAVGASSAVAFGWGKKSHRQSASASR
jgi:hypothetical protein